MKILAWAVVIWFVLMSLWAVTKNALRPEKRCRVCGYLEDGPLHDPERCQSAHRARTMTQDEIEGAQVYRMNEDIFGF